MLFEQEILRNKSARPVKPLPHESVSYLITQYCHASASTHFDWHEGEP